MKDIIKEYRLTEKQYESLKNLIKLVLDYNSHTNLTAIKNEKDFWEKHIIDSLELLKVENLRDKTVLDVGSGAGFPGLPLAIASETTQFTLVDANNKKTAFIKHAIEELELKNVEVINERVEDLKDDLWEEYDIVVSRAVSPLNILLEITSFAVALDGCLLIYKGANYKEEIPLEWLSVNPLGLKYDRTYHYQLSDKVDRYILKFDKFKSTDEKFPREFSKIKQNPIFN